MTTNYELYINAFCRGIGIDLPQKEFRFHETRRWRFDFAWPDQKVALEIEGGIWVGGAHTRGKHFLSDCEKYNTATCMGWKILRCIPKQVSGGEIIKFLEMVFDVKKTA